MKNKVKYRTGLCRHRLRLVAGLLGQTSVPDPQSVRTAKPARPEAPQPWWQDYRTQALALLLATGRWYRAFANTAALNYHRSCVHY